MQKKLDDLSILWSETVGNSADSSKASHCRISGLCLRTTHENGITKVSTTVEQMLIEMNDYTSIDSFGAYVATDGIIYTVSQGTFNDYVKMESVAVGYADGKTGSVFMANEKTSIYTSAGEYTDRIRVDSALPDYNNIHKGTQLPVLFSVTDLGTQPITTVEIEIDTQKNVFTV